MMMEHLYDSNNYLIVNKPFDMYINSDDPEKKNTLISHIALSDSHLKSSTQPLRFVHRLDYATSGAICLARHKRAAAAAGRCFERGACGKYYLAVVRGHVAAEMERADIEYDVGEDTFIQDGSNRMCAVTSAAAGYARARAARTRLLALERGTYGGDPATVVLLRPYTGTDQQVKLSVDSRLMLAGRRHQLRVHCAAVSHTILGDYTYSDRRDSETHRMFLHAIRLVIPLQNEPLDVETPEPFFSDTRFTSQWQTSRQLRDFSTSADRRVLYDFIESSEFCDANYKCFSKI